MVRHDLRTKRLQAYIEATQGLRMAITDYSPPTRETDLIAQAIELIERARGIAYREGQV